MVEVFFSLDSRIYPAPAIHDYVILAKNNNSRAIAGLTGSKI